MMKRLRSVLCIAICALLFPLAALAEDCFLIDVDSLDMNSLRDSAYVTDHLSAQTQGVRVRKYISSSDDTSARVRLTVTQAETNTVVFDKNYGYCSGTFDSGDIYLPYVDNNVIPYLITLNIEDWTYAMPFMHLQPRLLFNSACTYGIRMRDFNPALTDDWVMGTMLDLNALRSQNITFLPLCASNLYIIGEATVSVQSDQLSVSLTFQQSANVEVHGCAVYVIGDVSSLTGVNPSVLSQTAYLPGQPININGLSSALLYIPISLSYDPSGLNDFTYDPGSAELSAQRTLWDENLANVSLTVSTATPEPAEEIDAQLGMETPPENMATPEVLPEDMTTPEVGPEDTAQTDSFLDVITP